MIIRPLLFGTFTPYAILLSACAAVGLVLSWLLNKTDREHVVDGGLLIAILILFGSRLSFVIRNFPYFSDHLLEIPQVWLGGLSWPGGVVGAVGGIALVHLIWKEPLGELIDRYLPFLGMLVVGAWLAGWGSQAGYGPSTDSWAGIQVTDLFGRVARRWPLPIIGGVISASWTAGVIFFPFKRGMEPGFRGMVGVSGLILINGLISFFMVDPNPMFWGLRQESWISIVLFAMTLAYFYLRRSKKSDEQSDD